MRLRPCVPLLLAALLAAPAQAGDGYSGLAYGDAYGAQITRLDRRAPLAKAGLRRGDAIVGLDGDLAVRVETLREQAGSEHTLSVLRKGSLRAVRVALDLRGAELSEVVWGAGIGRIHPGSPGERAGLQVRDIVVEAGRRRIGTAQDLLAALEACDPGDELRLTLFRTDRELTLSLTCSEPVVNPYIGQVDAAIDDPAVRQAIRAVQPACVRVGRGASGVNLAPDGLILTVAHVVAPRDKLEGLSADELDAVKALLALSPIAVEFPDGTRGHGAAVAVDFERDLLVLRMRGQRDLPYARLADAAPAARTAVVCIGQPGGGAPDHAKPWNVSSGRLGGPAGSRELAALDFWTHTAWTWYGHSGSPLFDHAGRVVGTHALWDAGRGQRLCASHGAIQGLLKRESIELPDR